MASIYSELRRQLEHHLKNITGGITLEEGLMLFQKAGEVKTGGIVEIGSYRGKSAVALAYGVKANPKKLKIYCIDPHDDFEGFYGGIFGTQDRGEFYKTMLSAQTYNEVALINLPSQQVAESWKEPIGLLFIDGDHNYDKVKKDFELFEKHLLNRGLLLFDDALDSNCGPHKVVNEIISHGCFESIGTCGKIRVLKKRPDTRKFVSGFQNNKKNSFSKNKKNFLVLCEETIFSGGLLRFKRLAEKLEEMDAASMFFLPLSNAQGRPKNKGPYKIIDEKTAMQITWDATIIPGAGFSDSTIEKFRGYKAETFGTLIQFVLNDQSKKEKFLQVNQAITPDMVIFNNMHWPVGSFVDLQAKQFYFLVGAVDSRKFFPRPYRQHPLKEGEWIIGGLANKNPYPLIRALEFLPPTTKLRLFGHDAFNLAGQLKELVDSGRLSFEGLLVTDFDLLRFYHSVDCIVMTETYAGWSNLVAESMACGVPVICTRAGTLNMAENEVTALVLTEPSPDNITNMVNSLQDDPQLCLKLTQNARERISQFTWDNYAIEFMRIMNSFDGTDHYIHAPTLGLFGKWKEKTRLSGLGPLFELCENKTVLDLGAAEGIIARNFLLNNAKLVHGIERDSFRVEKAKEVCQNIGNADFRTGDLSQWKTFLKQNRDWFQDNYDIVLYLGIHHHIPAKERLELLRSITILAGTYVAVRTPSEYFNKEQIGKLITEAGFIEIARHNQGKGNNTGELRIYKRIHQVKINYANLKERQFVSFPKSGRSWIRYICTELGLDSYIIFHHDTFEYNNGSKPPLNFDLVARLKKYTESARVIYLERNPLDVMVSLYNQVTGRFKDFFNYSGSISDFIRDDYFGAENLYRFRKMWNRIALERKFLKVTYEDMHMNSFRTMERILTYFELDFDYLALKHAVENAEFSKMQLLEKSNKFSHPWLKPRLGSPKVRRGRVCGYKEVLSPEDVYYLKKLFGNG